MTKLSPKIKIGCPICGREEFELDIKDNFTLSEPKQQNKVTSIYNSSKPKKINTKVVSLF